ncbi:MAG: ADP-ribosylglycohydrolase family protein [Bacteroidetes bacterium]|nr:ADP-ribosylglycohydrolase family protein [Bacteroidota bacterium]
MKRKVEINKYTGCLLGGAIGDALGAPIEFMDINTIKNRFGSAGITDYVEHPNHVGEFTDDTQMTLFTAEGLLRAQNRATLKGIGGATVTITYQSYLRWLHTQGISTDHLDFGWGDMDLDSGWLIKEKALHRTRAPGNTCLESLRRGLSLSPDRPINNSKGCGAVMRMAPVGFAYYDLPGTFNLGCELGELTHGHPSGYLSAGVLAAIIEQLIDGASLREALDAVLPHLQSRPDHEEVLCAVNETIRLANQVDSDRGDRQMQVENAINQLGQGWVAEEALAISVFCSLVFENDFEAGVLAAVNHSGDSDSTGSITGNILGLINGEQAFPQRWIRNLKSADLVRQVGEDLFSWCKSDSFNSDQEWWEKYPGH